MEIQFVIYSVVNYLARANRLVLIEYSIVAPKLYVKFRLTESATANYYLGLHKELQANDDRQFQFLALTSLVQLSI